MAILSYLSFVIDERGFGNSATTGIALMFMTIASIVAGIFFAKIYSVLKKYSTLVAILINALGYFLLSLAGNIGMIFVAIVIIGFGFGFLMPLGTMYVTDSVPKSSATFANGIFMTFINLGTAISPTILVAVGKVFDKTDGQFIYLACSVALVLGALIAVGRVFMNKVDVASETK